MSLFNTRRRDAVDTAPTVTSATATALEPPQRSAWWRRDFYRRNEPVAGTAGDAAYIDGARDQHQVESDLERRAYRKGELDGRRLEANRRRGHPALATIVFLIALAGVAYGYLSFEQGSFSGGGAVIDGKIAQLRGQAGQAGVASGQAVQNAGADITAHGQALTQSSSPPTSGH